MTLGKILLVDDERDFANAPSQRLEARGLSVESVGNGMEALRKIREESFRDNAIKLIKDICGVAGRPPCLPAFFGHQLMFLSKASGVRRHCEPRSDVAISQLGCTIVRSPRPCGPRDDEKNVPSDEAHFRYRISGHASSRLEKTQLGY